MPSASGYMGEKYFQEFGPKIMTCPQLVGTWVKKYSGIWSQIDDMSSASGYMGETYFQEFGPKFLACRPGLHDML